MSRSLVFVALLLSVLVGTGCRRVPAPGGASGTKPEQARKQVEKLALNGVTGAATAQAEVLGMSTHKSRGNGFIKVVTSTIPMNTLMAIMNGFSTEKSVPSPAPGQAEPPQATVVPIQPVSQSNTPKVYPRPGPVPVIKDHVVSSLPYASENEAEEDTLTIARDVIQRRLAELDPPVAYRPTRNEVKNEFVRRDSRSVRPLDAKQREEFAAHGITSNLVFVEYDIELSAVQIRELRTRERIAMMLRVFSGLTVVALAGLFFLRADEWTKGYLTRWLAFIAIILAGGVAAVLAFV